MDAALAAEGIISDLAPLLAERDFEGAEELLAAAMPGASGTLNAFVHLQFARLYREWDKLTSAIDHLHRAAEVPGIEPFLRLQIAGELQSVKDERGLQRP